MLIRNPTRGPKEILRDPDRVVINSDGEAVSALRARRDFGIKPHIVFVRNDGWTLGARYKNETRAFMMWRGHWSGFIEKGGEEIRPIEEYKQPTYKQQG